MLLVYIIYLAFRGQRYATIGITDMPMIAVSLESWMRPPPPFEIHNHYAIPRENRFCFHYKNIVEDEKYFLLDCPQSLYKHVRKSNQNYLIVYCLLNPHSLVSTKQT